MSTTVHISPTGSDTTGDGTIGNPWATPEHVFAVVDDATPAGGNPTAPNVNTLFIRGGTYARASVFALADRANWNIQNYPGEVPIFDGSTSVAGSTLAQDDIPNDRYFGNYAGAFSRCVWVADGSRIVRSPRNSAAIDTSGWSFDLATGKYSGTTSAGLAASPNIAKINFLYDRIWEQCYVPIASATAAPDITLPPTAAANLDDMMGYHGYSRLPNRIVNCFEFFVDATLGRIPGTHYIHTANGKIYVYRPRDMSMATASIRVGTLNGAFARLTRCQNVTMSGVVFRYNQSTRADSAEAWLTAQGPSLIDSTHKADSESIGKPHGWYYTDGAAIELDACSGCYVTGNKIEHCGTNGIWLKNGTANCVVTGNVLFDLSGSGVILADAETPNPAAPVANNTVVGNIIRHFGEEYKSSVGVHNFYGALNTVRNNEIGYGGYSGISSGWGWGLVGTTTNVGNLIANNHVHHVMQYLRDGGGIYLNGYGVGNTISENVLHDIVGSAAHPLYTDDGCAGCTLVSNVMKGCLSDGAAEYAFANNNSLAGNVFTGNYSDTATKNKSSGGAEGGNTYANLHVSADPFAAAEAGAICNRVGLEAGYRPNLTSAYLEDPRAAARNGRTWNGAAGRLDASGLAIALGEFTVTYTINPGWNSGDGAAHVGFNFSNAGNTKWFIFQYYLDNTIFAYYDSTQEYPSPVSAAAMFASGKPVRLTVVVSAIGGFIKYYIDETLVHTWTRAVVGFTATQFTIGNYHGSVGANGDARGELSYFTCWTAALTASEIAAAGATHPSQVRVADLFGCWPINGDTHEYDSTGAARSLAISGSGTGQVVDIPVMAGQPSTPANLRVAVGSATSLVVSWTAPTDSAQTPKYRVYRSANPLDGFTLVADQAGLSFTDTARTTGTRYYYKVSAYNDAGESAQTGFAVSGIPAAIGGRLGVQIGMGL